MVDISGVLGKMRFDRTLNDKLNTYLELQSQVMYRELHLQTLSSFGIDGITPELITGLSDPSDFMDFIQSRGIKISSYMSAYNRLLNERCKSDTLALLLDAYHQNR